MKVIGIDPAPSKGLNIFDGYDKHVEIQQSRSYIKSLETRNDVLICWDAPLIGPPASVVLGGEATRESTFSQRPIESFFSREESGFKAPSGISTLPYSGCSHWAISRSLIGYPKTGPYDKDPPFTLMSDDNKRPKSGLNVVEVHPALALWLWCRESPTPPASWKYKGNDKDTNPQELWHQLIKILDIEEIEVFKSKSIKDPKSDDELDARVAYALGRLWLKPDTDSVVLLGNANVGTFLLPKVAGLEETFSSWLEKQKV